MDWFRLNALLDEAAAAWEAADHSRAVREYCHAISFMRAELKRQRGLGGDSRPGP